MDSRRITGSALRIGAALLVALVFAVGAYLLGSSSNTGAGLVGFSFLLLLPAAISLFVAYVGDVWNRRSGTYYRLVPVALTLAAGVIGVVFFREGVICLIMLAPLWVLSGLAANEIFYRWRRARRRAEPEESARPFLSSLVLVLPLVAMQVEPSVPLPTERATVSRSVIVRTDAATLWPLLEGIGDVRADEGHWNLTQDMMGVPRPVAATLTGQSLGADRLARWTHGVHFRERITEWQPGVAIGWRFLFDDSAGWEFTDPHLRPDSSYFRIETGGYRVEPAGDGLLRVTLHTRYAMRTPVNAYCRLWGELFLGDMESNLLAIIKARAESKALHPPA